MVTKTWIYKVRGRRILRDLSYSSYYYPHTSSITSSLCKGNGPKTRFWAERKEYGPKPPRSPLERGGGQKEIRKSSTWMFEYKNKIHSRSEKLNELIKILQDKNKNDYKVG